MTILGRAFAMCVPQLPAVRRVTSTKNPYVRHCEKLRTTKKYRDNCRRFLLVGKDVVDEVLDSAESIKTRCLFVAVDAQLDAYDGLAEKVLWAAEGVMRRLTGTASIPPDEVVAELDMPECQEDWTSRRVLALDGIQDPGNLGSLLRTCAAFGWGPVLLLPNCVDPYNDKVLKAARGAGLRVPCYSIQHAELQDILREKNLKAVGAAPVGGSSPSDWAQRDEGLCLCLGGEGQGLTRAAKQCCEEVLTIPLSKDAESLNVAVAGGILMHALRSNP